MFASFRKYKFDQKSFDEIVKKIEQEFVPLISKEPGFFSYYLLKAGGGELISVSVFENESAADKTNKLAADWISKSMQSLLPTPPEVSSGELVVYKIKSGGPSLSM